MDLYVGHPYLGEAVLEAFLGLAQAPREALDQGGESVDGEAGLRELGRSLGEVESSELPEAHGMVGDDDLYWGACELFAHGVELCLGLLDFLGGGFPSLPGLCPRTAGSSGPARLPPLVGRHLATPLLRPYPLGRSVFSAGRSPACPSGGGGGILCSPLGVQSVLTALLYVENDKSKRGHVGSLSCPTRPMSLGD